MKKTVKDWSKSSKSERSLFNNLDSKLKLQLLFNCLIKSCWAFIIFLKNFCLSLMETQTVNLPEDTFNKKWNILLKIIFLLLLSQKILLHTILSKGEDKGCPSWNFLLNVLYQVLSNSVLIFVAQMQKAWPTFCWRAVFICQVRLFGTAIQF